MRQIVCILVFTSLWSAAHAQALRSAFAGDTLDIRMLIEEALRNSQEIRAASSQIGVMSARMSQSGALADPELIFMREGMPGFRYEEAMFSRIELMQMFPFPGKLSLREDIALLGTERARLDCVDKTDEVVARLKSEYAELWYIQQQTQLAAENLRLLGQFLQVARVRYGVGGTAQQDILKGLVEHARLDNELVALRQRELAVKAMLMALLNRRPQDTLGIAFLPPDLGVLPSLDQLRRLALRTRPMLVRDSLEVEENRLMVLMARREFLPDFRLGVQYVTGPMTGFSGWTVTAGVSLPFAPWTLGKAGARVDEGNASVQRSQAMESASRAMVVAAVSELYYKAESDRHRIESFHHVILPRAVESLQASLTAYQNGATDFLMLIDSHRMLVELKMQALMARMQFEQTYAGLERMVGRRDLSTIAPERSGQ